MSSDFAWLRVVAGAGLAFVASFSAVPEVFPEGETIPGILKAHVDSFLMTITVHPVPLEEADPLSAGLRSVLLHTRPVLIEPHAIWPSGQPVSANALISDEEAYRIIDLLAKKGFFERARRYHSETRADMDRKKHPPPMGSSPITSRRPDDRKDRYWAVSVIVSDEYWYTYHEALLNWNGDMFLTLKQIDLIVGRDEASRLVGALRETIRIYSTPSRLKLR